MLWVLLAGLVVGQAESASIVDRLVGEWHHSGGPQAEREIENAVERAIDSMSFLSRGIARRRLLAASRIPQSLRIARDGDLVKIVFDDRERRSRIGTAPIKVIGSSGDELDYTVRIEDEALVQRFEGESGGRINTLYRQDEVIIVKVTIHSVRLPANVVYKLRYTRSTLASESVD
jgi:hypothetical protein